MKTTLTPSQSQRLIELGVDPSMASDNTELGAWADSEYGKPLFTLTDILALLPKEIESNVLSIIAVQLVVGTDEVADGWTATYVAEDMISAYGNKSICPASELIDALYNLLCWVLKNHTDKIKK